MQFSYGTQNTELGVGLFLLSQTGTYQNQNLRPFGVTVNSNTLTKLDEATRGGTNIGISAMQRVANDIIAPSAMPEGEVAIINGWRCRRFRFMLKVIERHPFMNGMTTQRIFFGVTDNCDASQNFLDPNMRIYFNSETVVTETLTPTANGPIKEVMVTGSNQIVSPIEYQAASNASLYTNPTAHLVRPEDLFSIGQSQAVVDTLNRQGAIPGGVDLILDSRTMVGQGGSYKYSARRDTSPTRFLHDTLDAFKHARMEAALTQNLDHSQPIGKEHLYLEAQSYATNQDIHSNGFFAMLKDRCGFMEKGYVTFGDLAQCFPEILRYKEVTHFSVNDGPSVRKVNHAEEAQHWNGSDPATIAASLLAQVIPAAMMDNYIRNVSFAATNGQGPNRYAIQIHDQQTRSVIDGVNMVPYLQAFMHRLQVDVLGVISQGNQIPFNISMLSDLAGDSVIDIRIGADAVTRFVAPTCTDSLFSPVITRRSDLLTNMANDLLYLVDQAIPQSAVSNGASVTSLDTMSNAYQPVQVPQSANVTPVPFNVNDYGLL